MPSVVEKKKSLTFQELLFTCSASGPSTAACSSSPTTSKSAPAPCRPTPSCACSGPSRSRIAYAQPSRRPADGRYGENPNRLFRHTQLQVILKPPPERVQELYLESPRGHRHRPRAARHQVRRGQLGVARRRRLGRGLAGHARRPGDHPVHLLPAVRRHGPRPHLRRDHLRASSASRSSCRTSTASTTSSGRAIPSPALSLPTAKFAA
jgi:hypothetical protein